MSVAKRRWGESLSARLDHTQRAQALLEGLVYNLNGLSGLAAHLSIPTEQCAFSCPK